MNPFRAITREVAIFYYKWARKDLRLQPMHPDLPLVVMRLNDLTAERPRPMLRNRCAGMPGMCMHDAACADYVCPGHPWQRLQTRDGGHQVTGELSVRIEHHEDLTDRDRVLIGSAGAALVALAAAVAHALGFPVVLLF